MIVKFRQISRLIHIQFILARHGLDNLILSLHLFRPLRFFIYANPWNWFRKQPFNRGQALRETLEDLGPIFVKFGQAMSLRRDLIPDDIADELTRLQDTVPPFPSEQAIAIVEEEFGQSIQTLFAEFSRDPFASASIAQVHSATLFEGHDVIVKIVRPQIEKQIKRDVELLYLLARLATRYWKDAARLHPIAIVKEFEQTIMDELDLLREAANASQLKRHFTNSHLLYVPEIHWEYTRSRVLVMERIYGISILNQTALRNHNINIRKLAERGVEIFFTQVFRDSFFHADMHPGNIFVSTENPDDPQYICVDFGIMGSLSHEDKRYLAENFHAFFQRDYYRVAELHVESGWVAPNTRIIDFESAIRTVCEPIFEKPLSQISCAQMLLKLFQIGRRFHMEIQPQLLLLQKTLFAIEGIGRSLYPELNLWDTAKPFLEKWMREEIGVKSFIKRMQSQLPYWSEHLPYLPMLLAETVKAQHQKLKCETSQHPKLLSKDSLKHSKKQSAGLTLAVVGGAGLISTFVLDLPLTLYPQAMAILCGLGTLIWMVNSQR